MKTEIIVYAHGSVESVDQLPAFVKEIRRGRPAPPELIAELTERYEAIGGSPLLEWTRKQAAGLAARTGFTADVAMRLSSPRIHELVESRLQGMAKGEKLRIILVTMAPFSVPVYEAAARKSLTGLDEKYGVEIELWALPNWGGLAEVVAAWTDDIFKVLDGIEDFSELLLLLSAHSLPQIVIDRGDPYAGEFEAAAKLVAEEVTRRLEASGKPAPEIGICYQSEGEGGGQWIGPNLVESMKKGAAAGKKSVCVAPLGFLAEHVETLYDLDIEAQSEAEKLDIQWLRVPTLSINSRFLDALAAEINKYNKD